MICLDPLAESGDNYLGSLYFVARPVQLANVALEVDFSSAFLDQIAYTLPHHSRSVPGVVERIY